MPSFAGFHGDKAAWVLDLPLFALPNLRGLFQDGINAVSVRSLRKTMFSRFHYGAKLSSSRKQASEEQILSISFFVAIDW